MPLSPVTWTPTMTGAMASKGFIGSNVPNFSAAVAQASVTGLVGKTFVTVDTGSVPGVGTGSGTGVVGIVAPVAQAAAYAYAAGAGLLGTSTLDILDAVMQSLVTEMGLATLSSSHAPVFVGAGVISPGSIAVVASALAATLTAVGIANGLLGTKWPDLAMSIAVGYQAGFLTSTGAVTITGSPTGPPVGGAGAGSGSIS